MSVAERLAQIEESPRGSRTAAFFDFDGTIIDGYSALPLMQERLRRRHIGPSEGAALLGLAVRGALGNGSFNDLMTVGVRAMAGRSQAELDHLGERLARDVLGGQLYPEALALVEGHLRQGHRLVVASSALPFQVEPLARELGFDEVLCTRPTVVDGTLDGTIDGPILWGPGKTQATRAYARARRVSLSRSFAYGNGAEDVEFLSGVGNPCAVNPHPDLESVADEQGWAMEHFSARGRPGVTATARTVGAYTGMLTSWTVGAGLGLLNRSRKDAVNLSVSLGSDVALSLAGVHLDVRGAEHLWSQRPAVFIFNHQSWLDGLIVMRLLREDITGVAKAEVARQPVIGQFGRLMGMAFVERGGKGDPRKALQPAVDKLHEGMSVAIAPEGTRSTTPRVGRFKKGAFHLARQAGVPIVPIVLRNAGELMWRGSKVIRPGTVDVRVLPPIDVASWHVDELRKHVEGVRELFVDTLAHWDAED